MEPREALRMHQQRNIIPGSYQDFLVNRHSDTIIQDLVKKLREASWMSGKRTRNVTFLGEQGIDAHGLTNLKEFFHLDMNSLMTKEWPRWIHPL